MRPVMRRRKYRPLFLVDIAVPRDVDPSVAELDQLYLYNIDDLEAVSREHLAQRQTEAAKAERIVEQTLREIAATEKVGEVVPILKAVREQAEEAARGELERAFHKRLVHLTTEEREAVRETVQRVVNKLLHPAMAALRDDRGALLDLPTAARVLHGLELGGAPEAPRVGTELGPALTTGQKGES
jgi:glutamyl-tRNA reductase